MRSAIALMLAAGWLGCMIDMHGSAWDWIDPEVAATAIVLYPGSSSEGGSDDQARVDHGSYRWV